ncbi:hypothetical protein HPP92_007463 [Vanilla planifolia]|uniref:Multiple C2 domain-containing protein n=1 Tax=Vanilla planifolia TaxID=51239 RepID=A0A835VB98_VANPL|nr:hypothetical protein HPP92_007646 [Vanilla planifolia]KAG0490600.1 hypothetical protein HPP92_007463 [Vanilla planifolia]
MLDEDSYSWSLRRSKANWFRIMGVIAWAVGLARWVDDLRRWRKPSHDRVGAFFTSYWCGARRDGPLRLSQADTVGDEPDEGVRWDAQRDHLSSDVRYDRLRTLAARQTVMATWRLRGEGQALVSWRDRRATQGFIGVSSLTVSLVLYVMPPKMVAVALGFSSATPCLGTHASG